MKRRRLRLAVPAKQPRFNSREGERAAWFRQERLKLSRPALGEKLGLSSRTIENYEKMDHVPELYRLAVAALAGGLEFDWEQVRAKVGNSVVTFGVVP